MRMNQLSHWPIIRPFGASLNHVALSRKTLESSLIEMPVPHGSVRDTPAHRVRMRQPTEEVRQLAVALRPDDKMPMVRQDTVRENPNRFTPVRLDHDAFERLKVGRLAEHVHPADGSVQDVVHKPPRATLAAL